MSKIKPGNKIAKAIGSRFIESKGGTLGFEVAFAFKEQDEQGVFTDQRLNWVGWLSKDAIDHTMKTMVEVLEFNGDDLVEQVPDDHPRKGMLTNQDAINRKKEVQLVVEMESYTDQKTGVQKTFPKIKWVNNVGGGQFAGVDAQTVKSKLGALGFKAAFLAAKKGTGVQPAQQPPMSGDFNESDVPF